MPSENVFNQSIWGDEGFSAILSMRPLTEIIEIISRDTSPPLWNIFEWAIFNTLGTDEIYIRSLALAFYLGTAFFVFKLGAYIFSKKTALIATLLILLNPFFFTYAFEGRMYSIMSLGVAGSMYYFWRIFKDEKARKRDKIGYVVFTLWALYSHHFAIFAVFVQGLWWIYEFALGSRKRAKKMFRVFLITALGYTPWLYPLYTQTSMVAGGFWLSTPTTGDLTNLMAEYLSQGIKNKSLLIPILNIPYFEAALYVSLAILVTRKWWKSIKPTVFLLLWFLGPILATWFISQKFTSVFFNRYLLYTIPAAMLILATARSKFSALLIGLLLAFFVIIDFDYFTHPMKLPFRVYSEYVKSELQDGDFLINWNANGAHHIWETKYYGIGAPIYVPEGDLPFFVGTALMMEGDIIREIPDSAQRVGVVTTGPIDEVSLPGYTEGKAKEFRDLKFIWYIKND